MCFKKKGKFYGLFPLGRHACGGQSQLDMPERSPLERKMGKEGKRKQRGGKKELSLDWLSDKDQK